MIFKYDYKSFSNYFLCYAFMQMLCILVIKFSFKLSIDNMLNHIFIAFITSLVIAAFMNLHHNINKTFDILNAASSIKIQKKPKVIKAYIKYKYRSTPLK